MKKKTSIRQVLFRARMTFGLLLLFFILIFAGTVAIGIKTGAMEKQIINPVKNFANEILKSLEIENSPKKVATNSGDLFLEFEKTTPVPKTQNVPVKTQPQKECNRYTVTHLDGSTSNLCYSSSDYNQLVNLGYNLSSAKTFYQFHREGAQKYQEEYNAIGSKTYLDAKASQERDAKREQDKIGSITLQIQEIEKRGY